MDRRRRRLLLAYAAVQLAQQILSVAEYYQLRKRRRTWVRRIFQRREELGQYHRLVQEMAISDRESYFEYFRMTPSAMESLLQLVAPLIERAVTYWRKPIEPAQRLCLTLRYLATGETMRSISSNYRVGYSTTSKIIRETCKALWDALQQQHLSFPTDTEWNQIAREFNHLWNFPNCVGALEGKHVTIQAPANSGSTNLNCRGYHSKVLMAMSDARYRFTMIDVGTPGRQNDSVAFLASQFGEGLHSGTVHFPPAPPLPGTGSEAPYVIVANEEFPLRTYLMRPYSGGSLNPSQQIFNRRLIRARGTVENAFGILANRWRILRGTIVAQGDTIDDIIRACCCLHNYLLDTDRQSYAASTLVDALDTEGRTHPGTWRAEGLPMDPLIGAGSTDHTDNAEQIRDVLTMYMLSSDGEVPWQYDEIQNIPSQEC